MQTATLLRVINLEDGRPTVEMARAKLLQAMRTAKQNGAPALKLIHGYGSSGKGGAIRAEVRQVLAQKKRAGELRAFATGEEFSPFCAEGRILLAAMPELAKDRDYARGNEGITIVLF